MKARGADADFLACDVRDDGVGDRLVSATVERFGALDVLVNNAGVLSAGDVVETTEEQWREIVDVNITSLFFISKSAVIQMRKQGGGCIVNIASEWGLNGEPGYLAYCTSKGAVVQMTRCMSLDHAQENIRVNSVCPGEVHTQMVDEMLQEAGSTPEELASGVPMRRLATPGEVANCVAVSGQRSLQLCHRNELLRRRRKRRHRRRLSLTPTTAAARGELRVSPSPRRR